MKKIYLFLFLICAGLPAVFGQVTYYSKAAATNFNDVNTWGTAADGTGTPPAAITSADIYTVSNGAVLNLSGNATVRQLVITSGTLTVSANTLNVQVPSQKTSVLLINGGTLNVSGGIINVDGYVSHTAGSFIQSGGTIIIDPNNGGVTATSTTGTQYTLNLTSALGVNWTGGSITITDPPADVAPGHYSVFANLTAPADVGVAHTINFGDGISADPGGSTIGFRVVNLGSRLNFGNWVVNAPSATNRSVTQSATTFIRGNLTINSGAHFDHNGVNNVVGGNIINNGTLTASGTLFLAFSQGSSLLTGTTSQTISGSGVFQDAASPTANFTNINANNGSAAGVIFTNGFNNIASQPANSVSISGTLTLTAGKVSSGNNLFVLGNSVPTTGALNYTTGTHTGGFPSGTTFGRWTTAASTGTSFTAGADPTNGTSRYPFITAAGAARSMWVTRASPTAAGIISVKYIEAAGTSAVSPAVADGAYSINTRSNDSWAVSISNGTAAAFSYSLAIVAPGVYTAPDATTRIMKISSVVGTHQAGTATPGGQRITIAPVDIAGTYYLGYALVVVPVAIDYFRGSKIKATNFLEWKVNCTSEPYVVLSLERSAEGRIFKTIDEQTAPNVRCLQGFNFTDRTAPAGTNYYRLKITSPNGQFRYSTIVTLLNKEKGFELVSLSPNPVKNNAVLSLSSVKAGIMQVSVTDVTGKIVMKQSIHVVAGNNRVNMNLSSLSAGSYNITVINAENELETASFVRY